MIKSELAKIGIDVDIQTYELLTAYAKEDGGHSQMGQRYWTNDIIDPDEVTTFAVDPKGGANAFNTLLEQRRGDRRSSTRRAPSVDPAKRAAMYKRDPEDRLRREPVPGARLQPVPLRAGQVGARASTSSPLGNYNLSLLNLTVDDALRWFAGGRRSAPAARFRAWGATASSASGSCRLIPVLFGITVITFFLLRLIPGDPARRSSASTTRPAGAPSAAVARPGQAALGRSTGCS